MSSSLAAPVAVEYPDSDGKPLAESDFQLDDLTYARDRLRIYYHDQCRRHDVYVAGNLLIYYEEGNRNVSVAPDIFVVLGVPHYKRRSYRLWEEGKVPDFVLEITSHSTWEEDRGKKRELYRRLGVTEYWQYDPTGDYLEPVLQGLELAAGEYVPIAAGATAEGLPTLESRVLGLELHATDDGLRFHDPVTEQYLPTSAEDAAARVAAEAQAAAEATRADAEATRADAEAARADTEAARADTEAARADTEAARADAEAEARAAAEARVAELEAKLRDRSDPRR